MSISVFIVEDHKIVCDAFASIVKNNSKFELIGTANNGTLALQKIYELKPNVVICDLALPDITGLDIITKVVRDLPEVNFLVVSMFLDKEFLYRAYQAGAKGMLSKGVESAQIVEGIEKVANAEFYFGKEIDANLMVKEIEQKSKEEPYYDNLGILSLGTTEKSIIKRLIKSYTLKEIENELQISSNKANFTVQMIYGKFEVKSADELTMFVLSNGVLKTLIDSAE